MTDTIETTATISEAPATENGAVLFVPLGKLKKSPRNARKTPHSDTHIEALAASIAAKGMLQNLVVEPETNAGANLPAAISSPSAKAAGWRRCCA